MTEKNPLYLVKANSDLIQMKPSAPANEDELQELIARHPQLIGDSDGELLLIEREHGVPDSTSGVARWSVDHLFVTRSATPVLVEVKRAVDTRLRREVVGQMLDYAANGVAYWPSGSLAARFEAACAQRGDEPQNVLLAFLGEEDRVATFWTQVDANLRAGNVKLLFVADEVPVELARIVEFLNEQMKADVRAIELTYFDNPDGTRLLAPRIIGETERTRVEKGLVRPKLDAISKDEWLKLYIEPKGTTVTLGAQTLLALMQELADEIEVASTQGSIYARIKREGGKASYPFFLTRSGTGQIGFGWLGGSPALADETVRQEFYDRLSAAVGPLSTKNLRGFPSFPLERLAQPEASSAFATEARAFVQRCRQ